MWVLGLGVEVAGAAVAGDVVVGLPRATGIQAEMAKGALRAAGGDARGRTQAIRTGGRR